MFKKRLTSKLMAIGLFTALVISPLPQLNFSSTQPTTVAHAESAVSTPTPSPTPSPYVVSSNPATAVAGNTVTITYNAVGRVLQNSSTIKLHWGYDSWITPTDTVMTSVGNGQWSVTITVPTAAKSSLNVCFTDGSKWDNNSSANWSIPVTTPTPTSTPIPINPVDSSPSTGIATSTIEIFYHATGRVLENSSTVTMHWGYDGWTNVTNTVMNFSGSNLWTVEITIPSAAKNALNFNFTNGTSWDDNSSANWSIPVIPPPAVSSDYTPLIAGYYATITYNANGRVLQNSSTIKMHWGYDGWITPTDTVMTSVGNNIWKVRIAVPIAAKSTLNVCFTNGASWDNNSSANWSFQVKQMTPSPSPTLTPTPICNTQPPSSTPGPTPTPICNTQAPSATPGPTPTPICNT